jgi:hypothetical protein
MIQFGSSSVCGSGSCTGISLESLTLDGNGQTGNGITNQFAQTNTYVNHVRIYQVKSARYPSPNGAKDWLSLSSLRDRASVSQAAFGSASAYT